MVGGMLSASGCATQNLFRNDLASPHVLGVVNSAALGAVAGFFIGTGVRRSAQYRFWNSFTGAVVYPRQTPGLGCCRPDSWPESRVNAFSAALTSGALYLADERLSSAGFLAAGRILADYLAGYLAACTGSGYWLDSPV